MQRIIYRIVGHFSVVRDGKVVEEERLALVSLPYSEENLARAQAEAYEGAYTIDDDGETPPEASDDEDIWAIMAEALREGVNSV